jgi:hypothetical protein
MSVQLGVWQWPGPALSGRRLLRHWQPEARQLTGRSDRSGLLIALGSPPSGLRVRPISTEYQRELLSRLLNERVAQAGVLLLIVSTTRRVADYASLRLGRSCAGSESVRVGVGCPLADRSSELEEELGDLGLGDLPRRRDAQRPLRPGLIGRI